MRKRKKTKAILREEKAMEDLLKRVGYKGNQKRDSVHNIPTYSYSKNVTSDTIPGNSSAIQKPKYSGEEILGISQMHKSNAVPIRKDNKKAAIETAQMRRS